MQEPPGRLAQRLGPEGSSGLSDACASSRSQSARRALSFPQPHQDGGWHRKEGPGERAPPGCRWRGSMSGPGRAPRCPAPGRAAWRSSGPGGVGNGVFWLHRLIAQCFGPPRLAAPRRGRSRPERTGQRLRTGRDVQGKGARPSAARLRGRTPRSPASPRAAGGEEGRRPGRAPPSAVSEALACTRRHPPHPHLSLRSAVLLLLLLCISSLSALPSSASSVPQPSPHRGPCPRPRDRRGPGRPLLDALVSPCLGLLLSLLFLV